MRQPPAERLRGPAVIREHDTTLYGKNTAADYDVLYGDVFDTDGAVYRLAQLADRGPILEWGVGTGRLALGLVARGLQVHGLDSSAEMIEILARKPGGDRVATTIGDFSTTRVDGSFSMVVLAINTLYA
jgi:2-polyprenyl-3-methyl-5-hydroxy-6-metoxy-1,4-benzoquinol methylase